MRVLDFDHFKDKIINIGDLISKNRSMDFLIQEMEKCDIRCSNCHRRKTLETYPTYKTKTPEDIQEEIIKDQTFLDNLPIINMGNGKLTREQAEQVRQEYATGNFTYVGLANKYGVKKSTTANIIQGKSWKV